MILHVIEAFRELQSNKDEWERVREVPDGKQEKDGFSRRVLLRNKTTGEEIWVHELQQKKPPQAPHPHVCNPPDVCTPEVPHTDAPKMGSQT